MCWSSTVIAGMRGAPTRPMVIVVPCSSITCADVPRPQNRRQHLEPDQAAALSSAKRAARRGR